MICEMQMHHKWIYNDYKHMKSIKRMEINYGFLLNIQRFGKKIFNKNSHLDGFCTFWLHLWFYFPFKQFLFRVDLFHIGPVSYRFHSFAKYCLRLYLLWFLKIYFGHILLHFLVSFRPHNITMTNGNVQKYQNQTNGFKMIHNNIWRA